MPTLRRPLRALPRRVPLEAWAWGGGLLALALADPDAPGLLSTCGWQWLGVPALLGASGCPGCGLGHGVAFLLEGRLGEALGAHVLAPFALAALGGRTATLAWQALFGPPAAASARAS